MENLLTFTGIIIIIFGILQIILFFKMWGMTNNVKKIKEKYFEEVESRKYEKEAHSTPTNNESNTPKNDSNRVTSQELHAESTGGIKNETHQTPTKPIKHYDLAEKDINKLKVLKKRGFIEQATNEFISLTSASKEDASSNYSGIKNSA